MIGITPAVFTFKGIELDCPPVIFLPTIFLEYCTGIFLTPPLRINTSTTTTRMIAIIISAAKPPLAYVFPFTNWSNKVTRSLGILDTIFTINTIEIPFPIPLSVICSPIHISIAEPAVKQATTTTAFIKFISGISPLLPKPTVIAIDWNKERPIVR